MKDWSKDTESARDIYMGLKLHLILWEMKTENPFQLQ